MLMLELEHGLSASAANGLSVRPVRLDGVSPYHKTINQRWEGDALRSREGRTRTGTSNESERWRRLTHSRGKDAKHKPSEGILEQAPDRHYSPSAIVVWLDPV
jgi:hypothetical protein